MTPSYRKICKTLLHQKQFADKRIDKLYKKVNNLEKKAITLESLQIKFDDLSRENVLLELELRELKEPRDPTTIMNLEKKSIYELINQILTLTSQVSVLEKTNTELWVEKKRLSRELNALKLNPLSVVCCDSKNCISHPAKIVTEDEFSSTLGNENKSTWNRYNNSYRNAEDAFVKKEVERKKLTARDSPCRFTTPIKSKLIAETERTPPNLLPEKSKIPIPPFAVFPPWCPAIVEEEISANRSMDVSTLVCTDLVDDNHWTLDTSMAYSTSTAYKGDDDTMPMNSSILSTTCDERPGVDVVPAGTESVIVSAKCKDEIDRDVNFDGYSSSTSYKRIVDGTKPGCTTLLSATFEEIDEETLMNADDRLYSVVENCLSLSISDKNGGS